MSASREKKKRQDLYQTGVSKQTTEPVEKKTPGWKVAVYWLIGIVFVICFAVVMLLNSNFFAKNTTAATVGEHKVSPAMMNIYYGSAYSNFYTQYEGYINYLFDPNQPLDEQVYDETTGQTWADYFMTSATDSLTWAYTLYDEAVEAGAKLSAEDEAAIDETLDSFKEAATVNGYASVDGYLTAYFGKGVDAKVYREFMEVQFLASNYYNVKLESFSFTDEEKFAYYAENVDTLDTITAEYSYLKGTADPTITTDEEGNETTVEPTEEQNAAALEAALEKAEEIKAGGAEAIAEYDRREITDYAKATITYVLPTEAADWLFDSARVEGDIEIFDTTAAVYVVRFISRDNHDYLTRNIRLVQMTPETVEDVLGSDGKTDTEATAEAQKQANDKTYALAKEAYEAWQDGEATEESFINELVAEFSDDAASKDNEGLVESITKSDFTEEVVEWLYDSKREKGDCELFTNENTGACFIIYYLEEGVNAQLVMVESGILTDAYNTWYEEASAAYPVTENSFGMRFVSFR